MLKIRAIEHTQGNKKVYSLSIQGNKILDIASINNARRDEKGHLLGYQRIKVQKHISEIKDYMNKSDAILPNAIVMCFDSKVRFEEIQDGMGYLHIPTDKVHGFIVDGQQRSTAMYEADELVNKTFEVTVNAFIADNAEIQREQFMLVNNTKPLPKTLLNELMPNTVTKLPKAMEEKKLPNQLVQLLNNNEHSVFFNRIRTHTKADGYITETSLLNGIKTSLTDGCLFGFTANSVTGLKEHDIDSIITIIDTYFKAISEIWSEDFNSKPKDTRLTHGSGIHTMLCLLDHIEVRINKNLIDMTIEDYKNILVELNIDWKQMLIPIDSDTNINIMHLQNNSKDKKFLSNFITRTFEAKVKNGTIKQ